MSIKKEVVLRSEIYTIYSSEMQERMKVYFQLQEQYKTCKDNCVGSSTDDTFCENLCSKIFDDYAKKLENRYKDDPEKLNEVVQNSPIFEARKTEE